MHTFPFPPQESSSKMRLLPSKWGAAGVRSNPDRHNYWLLNKYFAPNKPFHYHLCFLHNWTHANRHNWMWRVEIVKATQGPDRWILPLCELFSSQSRSASEGALGREKSDTGWSSGHSLPTLLIIMHPKGTHSSERQTYPRNKDCVLRSVWLKQEFIISYMSNSRHAGHIWLTTSFHVAAVRSGRAYDCFQINVCSFTV